MTSFIKEQRLIPGPLDDKTKDGVIRIWMDQDPRSLIRLVPEKVREAILRIPEEMRSLSEPEMKKLTKPTPTDRQLRLSFWMEYNRAQDEFNDAMSISRVIAGICTEEWFYGKFIKDHKRMAWLITPPTAYIVAMDEALDLGMERMREILDLQFVDPETGRVDAKVAKLVMQAHAYLDMRKNGAIAQKLQIDQRTVKMDLRADAKDVNAAIQGKGMEEINKRLAYLEKRERMIEKGEHPALASRPVDLEVTAESVTDAEGEATPVVVVEPLREDEGGLL